MSKKKVFAALIFGSILLTISTACTKQNTGQSESISHEEMNLQELKETDDILPMDFNLQDQYGKLHSLSKYKGKNVILVFWATWCTDCIEELPDIEKLYLEHKDAGQEDLFIFGINTPNKEPETDISKINAFMKENNYTFSTLMDEDGKIYEASASQMFGVPINTIAKGEENYHLRAKGKVAELALGYQGSVGALTAMGAADMGLTDEEMKDIVDRWRKSSKRIVELWYALENAAVEVLETGEPQMVKCVKLAREYDFIYGQDFFTVELPSGRKLFYPKPFLKENQFGQMQMHYMGINQTTKKWEVIPTYGGKLTENIVQAIARDCLTETLLRIKAKGWPIVFHVHDEVILDVPTSVELEEVIQTMTEEISWAKGLILNAAGFTGSYYMKD